MSKDQTDQLNDDLTDEEIAALEELNVQSKADGDEPEFNPDDVYKPDFSKPADDDNGEDEQEPDETDPATDKPAEKPPEKPGDKGEGDKDEPGEGDEQGDKDDKEPAPAPEQRKPAVPLLVAEAPEGYDDRMSEIAAQKEKLAEAFDDGDKTAKEYHAELDALNREERVLERSKDRYELAQQMETQRVTNDRQAEINVFLASVGIPQDPADLKFSVLDRAVRLVASDEQMATATVSEIMTKAYDLCAEQGVLRPRSGATTKDPAPAPKKPAEPEPKKPPVKKGPQTLADIPQSEVVDTDSNQFAHLNRMHPDDREAAFSRMTPAQQNAYLEFGS